MRKPYIYAVWASLSVFALANLNVPGTAQSKSNGAILIDKHACKNCHLIKGEGGNVGPPLDGLGEHRSEAFIISKLRVNQILPRRKKLYPVPYELMSHVHVPGKDVAAIATYLRSLPPREYQIKGHAVTAVPDDTPAGSSFKPDAMTTSAKRGSSLFKEKGCFACHSIDGFGGQKGPSLDGVGATRSRRFISDRVARGALILPDPDGKSGQVAMPDLQLTETEIRDITGWLMTLPVKK